MNVLQNKQFVIAIVVTLASGIFPFASSGRDFQSDIVDIVSMVFRYYHRGCLVILTTLNKTETGISKSTLVYKIMKRFHSTFISSIVVSFHKQINDTNSNLCKSTSPLFLLPFTDDETRATLINLSHSENLASRAWVLFYSSELTVEEYFSDINVPFNCKFLVVKGIPGLGYSLTEVYRVSPGSPVKTFLYGTWMNRVHNLSSLAMYERRTLLDGIVIKAAAIQDSPFTILKNESGTSALRAGYLGRLWTILQNKLNFTTAWQKPEEDVWGVLENGSWNGMVEMVRSQAVEVAVGAFVINAQRLGVIDYTIPIFMSDQQVFIKVPTRNMVYWDDFLLPFSSGTWCAVAGAAILLTVYFLMFHWVGIKIGSEDEDNRSEFTIQEVLFIVFAALCQKGCATVPRSLACRTILLTWYVTVVVLLAAYSAALISSLTRQVLEFPFYSFEGLLQDGSYRFTVLRKSAEFQYFKESNNSVIRQVFEEFLLPKEHELPTSQMDAITQLCYGFKVAFLSTATHLLTTRDTPNCNVIPLPIISLRGYYAIIFTKRSWYKDAINFYLRRFRDSGSLKRILLDEVPHLETTLQAPWISVSFSNVLPSLLMFLVGILIALFVVFVERRVLSLHMKNEQNTTKDIKYKYDRPIFENYKCVCPSYNNDYF